MSNFSPHSGICRVCGRYGELQCARCSSISVFYCSSTCQDNDYEDHRQYCDLLAPAAESQSIFTWTHNPIPDIGPTLSHPFDFAPPAIVTQNVQAIVLPVDRTVPYITTVRVSGSQNAPWSRRWVPELDDIEGTSGFLSSNIIATIGDGMLRFPLQIHYEADSDTIALNKCVLALTGGSKQPWKGNMVVLKFSGTRRLWYTDANADDISTLQKYLLDYRRHA
ncbi:hypothetical protein BDV93DRAFT_609495 [Ceratobasidium sp. AG-I]|nr:hypothetical protein BDV93DRAFT_609495 [Ceratobasidium sp. AG-I]